MIVLASMSLVTMGQYWVYEISMGIEVLKRSQIWPYNLRIMVSIIMNLYWFAMSYHYIVIAAIRLHAIAFFHDHLAVCTKPRMIKLVIATWLAAALTDAALHISPYYVYSYFDYKYYGFVIDRPDCVFWGVQLVWAVFNPVAVGLSILISLVAIVKLFMVSHVLYIKTISHHINWLDVTVLFF